MISKSPQQTVPLFNYNINCEKRGKYYHYSLTLKEEIKYKAKHRDSPAFLNQSTDILRNFKHKLSGNLTIEQNGITANIDDELIETQLQKCMDELDDLLVEYELHKDDFKAELLENEKEEKLRLLSEQSDKFRNYLDENNASLIDFLWYVSNWLSGGESQNTLTGFVCHISTYFKIKPVWFFALGKAGEGKSVIEEASIELIPDNAVMNGRASDKVVYRKTQELGNDYIDGKILLMKDLGEDGDTDKWKDTLGRYKELTTEGKTEFEVVGEGINEETGEKNLLHFTVTGKPSVLLTTVHSESFNDQIMSRGHNVSPVASNDEVRKFHYYNKGRVSQTREKIIENEIGLFKDYVEYICSFYEGMKVINPYWTCLEKWFHGSEYYKRALTLYPSLVEAVTLLHYHDRDTIKTQSGDYLISSKEDNKFVADLFNPSQGISEPAIRLFNMLLKWFDELDENELEDYREGKRLRACKTIFSVGEVRYKCSRIQSLKGLDYGAIMSSLVSHGLIEAVDKVKRSKMNIYILSHFESLEQSSINFDEKIIEKYIKDLEWLYGLSPVHLRKVIENENTENLTEDNYARNTDFKLPPWVTGKFSGKSLVSLESGVYKGNDVSVHIESAKMDKNSGSVHIESVINHDKLVEEELREEWSDFE